MRAVSLLALGAALISSGASAQVIQRSVNEEPVETIVTRTPEGTVITRRPLGAAEQQSIDAITTREVVRRVETRPPRVTTRTTKVRRTARIANDRREVVTRTIREPVPVIALSPAERHIVYRTIVDREVVPAPRVVAPYRDAWRDPNWRDQTWRDQTWREPYNAPVVAADEDVEMTTPAYAYAVGSVLPANVPLFAVPQEVGYRVPAAQPYSYAYVGRRAYLVDPGSGVIVADVTE